MPRLSESAASRASASSDRLTPKLRLAASVPAIDWKTRSTGAPALDGGDLGGDVGQHAALGGDGKALAQRVEHTQQRDGGLRAVGGGVDADHRVAHAEQQPVDDRGGDALRVVGGVVGLQARRQPPLQPDRVAERGDDATLTRYRDQILVAHDLRHGRGHLGRHARRQRLKRGAVRRVGQQPLAERAYREAADWRERRTVVRVADQARHLVVLVGYQRLVEKDPERHVGQTELGGHALFGAFRGHARQLVARALGRGLRKERLKVIEAVGSPAEGLGVGWHGACSR